MGDDLSSARAIGKLDMLNQLFRSLEAVAVIIDGGKAVCIKVGNTDYYFNPATTEEGYIGIDGEKHHRTVLKYDGWEKHL